MNNFNPKISQHNQKFIEMMKNIDRNYGKLQLLESLFSSKDIVYVDPNKNFCIVQTNKYNELRDTVSTSKDNIQILSNKIYEYQMQITKLNKERQFYQTSYQRLKQNETLLRDNILDMSQRLKQNNRQFINMEQQIALLTKQNKSKIYSINNASSLNKHENLQEKSIQTMITPQILQENIQQPQIQEIVPQVDRIQVIQSNLYQSFQQKISFFQQQLGKKLESLQNQEHLISKWQQENQVLQKENQELKQNIIDRNIQQQKLAIWKSNVFEFISRIQSNVTSQNNANVRVEQKIEGQISSLEVQDLKSEIVHLRGKIAEMKQQVKWVDEFMVSEQEINQDGAVGLLVRLTQKLKGIVRNMLLEVQMP